jgi:uncharacterized NAD-dependent epimerase/dehydratase family protein
MNGRMSEQPDIPSTMDQVASSLLGHRRIVLLTEGFSTHFLAKTAISLLRYRTRDVAAVLDGTVSETTAGELFSAGEAIPVVAALSDVADADALYVGIAPPGGKLPDAWRAIVVQALQRGLDVVSGLHDFLTDDDEFVRVAGENNCQLIDVRRNRLKETAECRTFPETCVRIHTVGQDCSIGKMVASLETQLGLTAKDYRAKFLATGQTGIMISGQGVPIDCVVADFVSGAAERLVAANEDNDFVLIEGQGSISHPAYSAVTLGLLHGTAPNGLIYCYEAGRTHVKGFDHVEIPPLEDQMAAYLTAANLRHPCKFIGVAVNTRRLDEDQAAMELQRAEQWTGLPACDVYRTGAEKLVEACIRLRREQVAS